METRSMSSTEAGHRRRPVEGWHEIGWLVPPVETTLASMTTTKTRVSRRQLLHVDDAE